MPSRSELAEKTKKDLKGEARRIGVSDEAIDDAGEADDEKAALIDLIVAAGDRSATSQRSALAGKTKKELKGEARSVGVRTDDIDDAGEAADEKAALIDLIMAAQDTISDQLETEKRAMFAAKTKKELKAT